ncbi:MAG: GerMN domain-containing protein, partial [Cyanobacteria bacterium J06636_27]
MTEQNKTNRISSGVMAAIATAAVAVAGVTGYFTFNPPGDTPGDPDIVEPGDVNPNPPVTNEKKAEVYWLESNGTGFSLQPQDIQVQADANNPSEFLEAAFNSLLAGPTEGSGSTAIPQETKLLGIKAEGDEVRV